MRSLVEMQVNGGVCSCKLHPHPWPQGLGPAAAGCTPTRGPRLASMLRMFMALFVVQAHEGRQVLRRGASWLLLPAAPARKLPALLPKVEPGRRTAASGFR